MDWLEILLCPQTTSVYEAVCMFVRSSRLLLLIPYFSRLQSVLGKNVSRMQMQLNANDEWCYTKYFHQCDAVEGTRQQIITPVKQSFHFR